MTDHYSQFSEQISDLTPEEAEWVESVLNFREDRLYDETMAALVDLVGRLDLGMEDVDMSQWPGFEWETSGAKKVNLKLYCQDAYEDTNLIVFVQAFIRKWRPDFIFMLSGAGTCSKTHIGEFGGFWIVITRDQVFRGSTWDTIDERVAMINTARGMS